jgi:hypothetical protein
MRDISRTVIDTVKCIDCHVVVQRLCHSPSEITEQIDMVVMPTPTRTPSGSRQAAFVSVQIFNGNLVSPVNGYFSSQHF